MADTNNERVGKALALLAQGLAPFVDRECGRVFGPTWDNTIQAPGTPSKADVQFLLRAMAGTWRDVFERTLGRMERNYVSELIEARNRWAHQETFTSDDAYRVLDSAERLLQAISAGEQAAEVGRMKHDLQRRRYTEEARTVARRQAAQPLEGMPSANLKSWRQVVTPHRDVATGQYQQAEFAADLHQVWRDEAEDEYGKPEEFFRRTFLTEGLRDLLLNAARRLGGVGGGPIVQLQTNFGGGKTHSLIALYHLAGGYDPVKLPGVEQMLAEAGIEAPPEARRAVLVGQMLDPGSSRQKPDGTIVQTMWGELAWQLGAAEGYSLVSDADAARTSPGERLIELLARYSPCLILIDEWVAYARQLYGRDDLPGGSFDTQMTFAQALSDAAKGVKDAMLVVSIPASDIEVGGEAGKAALERLSNVIFRQEASWKPASAEEGFEIVRRRLFDDVPAEFARERDAVVNAFGDLYQKHSAEFPLEAREGHYRRRLQAAYPIHPELFDQLFENWSTLEKFQRTRGVLRLMASVIHELWARDDAGLLIMPASVPIDAPAVQAELTRYLDEGWTPVIESDVDGPNALPRQLDLENPNLKRYSATRRVARTVYLGSAPTLNQTNRGIDDRSIKLGCVQPGESPAIFGDALRRLSTRAMYLVEDHGQYWYALGQTISRTAEDRKQSRFLEEHADEEICRRLLAVRDRGHFAGVHWAPRGPADVPDEDRVRLVVLGPDHPHAAGTEVTEARATVKTILAERAAGPRLNRNMLVFVAPDKARLAELRDAARAFLAWESIVADHEELNLDAQQRRHAETQQRHFDGTSTERIGETFVWLLTPRQEAGKSEVLWEQTRVTGQEPIPSRVSRRLSVDEGMITEYSGARLRMDLDRVPLWANDHVGVRDLWSYYAQYLYLPRLRDSAVLLAAIRDGVSALTWRTDTFAYASGYDDAKQRYMVLVAGQQADVALDGAAVVVRAEAAQGQLETEPPPGGVDKPGIGGDPGDSGGADGGKGTEIVLRRFYGRVVLEPVRLLRDVGQIAEALVAHLNRPDGSAVSITVEIEASASDGFSEDLRRTVSENARTLKFETSEFES